MAMNDQCLDQIFRNARTHNAWLEKPVDDSLLRQAYDLAKMGPTSANMCPMRIVFVKTPQAKERLKPSLDAANAAKTMAAPVTAIIGMDIRFYEQLPKLFPHAVESEDVRPAVAPAVEALMRAYYLHARGVVQVADRLLEAARVPAARKPRIGRIDAAFLTFNGELAVRDRLERPEETECLVVRQPIEDEGALATGRDEVCLSQHAAMRAGVLDRHLDLPGDILDGALTLGEEVEQLEPFRAGERVADPRELRVQLVFVLSFGHR